MFAFSSMNVKVLSPRPELTIGRDLCKNEIRKLADNENSE